MNPNLLLWSSLESSVLFLTIWAVFRALPSMDANWKAWIWRLALLKPLASLLPFAVVSLHILPASIPDSSSGIIRSAGVAHVSSVANVSAGQDSKPSSSTPDLWFIAWLIAASAIAGAGVQRRLSEGRIVSEAKPVTCAPLLQALEQMKRRAGVSGKVRLVHASSAQCARLVGGLTPTIVLPTSALEPDSLQDARLMLAHELAHLARRDLPWFGAVWVVQSLFFFNPVVWLAANAARQDHESATDRLATELAETSVHDNAEMLVRAAVVARPSLVPGALPMAESYRTIHRRLEAMKQFNTTPSHWRKAAAAAICLATLGLMPTFLPAQAFQPPSQQVPAHDGVEISLIGGQQYVNMTLNLHDVRDAVQLMFSAAHREYSMDAKFNGKATLSVTNITFDNAMENLVRQVGGSYRIEHGVYRISSQPFPPHPVVNRNPRTIRNADLTALVSVGFDRVDAREALRNVFRQTQSSYTIDVMVQGTVSISMNDIPLKTVLDRILGQIDSTYTVKDGVIHIARKPH